MHLSRKRFQEGFSKGYVFGEQCSWNTMKQELVVCTQKIIDLEDPVTLSESYEAYGFCVAVVCQSIVRFPVEVAQTSALKQAIDACATTLYPQAKEELAQTVVAQMRVLSDSPDAAEASAATWLSKLYAKVRS